MKHDALSPFADATSRIDPTLSGPQVQRLLAFETLLIERAAPAGLVAEADVPRLRERHILDCLRAAPVVEERDRSACDLGSGAGLPGIVVGIARPGLAVTLVETRRRRAAFLELAVERLQLPNVKVAVGRIEEVEDVVDLCFARALAPLDEAWALSERLLVPTGRLVYFAGRGATGPFRVPGAGPAEIRETPMLERAGPLVIIARQ